MSDTTCDEVPLDVDGFSLPFDAVTAGPVPDGLWGSDALFFSTFIDTTGITCDRANVAVGDPNYTPLAGVMDPGFASLSVSATQPPEGGMSDFYTDLDADGILENNSARFLITLYDVNVIPLCVLEYEADTSIEIDPTTWNPVDVAGGASGPLYTAYEITLGDAESSDCLELDALIWGTTNPADLFAGATFGYAFGAPNDMTVQGPVFYGAADWGILEPLADALYVSLDGIDAIEVGFNYTTVVSDCQVNDVTTAYLAGEQGTGVRGGVVQDAFYVLGLTP